MLHRPDAVSALTIPARGGSKDSTELTGKGALIAESILVCQ